MDSTWNRIKRKRYVFRWGRVESGMKGNLTWSCYMKMEKPESSFSSPGRPPRYLIFPHDHHRQQRLHPRVFIFPFRFFPFLPKEERERKYRRIWENSQTCCELPFYRSLPPGFGSYIAFFLSKRINQADSGTLDEGKQRNKKNIDTDATHFSLRLPNSVLTFWSFRTFLFFRFPLFALGGEKHIAKNQDDQNSIFSWKPPLIKSWVNSAECFFHPKKCEWTF